MAVKNVISLIKENPAFLPSYLQAMSLLNSSYVLDFLMEKGRATPVLPGTPNYVEFQNAEFNRSIGYNQCLNDLINFKELFLESLQPTQLGPMDYGATEKLQNQDDITKEEADALRLNKPVPLLHAISAVTNNTRKT